LLLITPIIKPKITVINELARIIIKIINLLIFGRFNIHSIVYAWTRGSKKPIRLLPTTNLNPVIGVTFKAFKVFDRFSSIILKKEFLKTCRI
jgi:hypothetical protein